MKLIKKQLWQDSKTYFVTTQKPKLWQNSTAVIVTKQKKLKTKHNNQTLTNLTKTQMVKKISKNFYLRRGAEPGLQ